MRTERFVGKSVLVTGGAQGIGEAVARAFAVEGATVIIADRSGDDGRKVAASINEQGGSAHFVEADFAAEPSARKVVEEAVKLSTKLDVVFANAGVLVLGEVTDFTVEDYDKVFNTNVRGLFLLLKHAIPELRKTKGTVVATSSVAGLRGFPGNALYSASKHAVEAIIKCAALDNARHGVRLSTINPGVVETEMFDRMSPPGSEAREKIVAQHPLGRAGKPADMAGAVLFLASEEGAFVTGVSLPVDGGFTLQ